MELRSLQRTLPRIRQHGGQLIAISPQLPDQSLNMVKKEELAFEVLSDLKNKTAKDFGLVFTLPKELQAVYEGFGIDLRKANGNKHFTLPVPATYIVDTHGIIISHLIDADYTKRFEPEDIIEVLKGLEGRA